MQIRQSGVWRLALFIGEHAIYPQDPRWQISFHHSWMDRINTTVNINGFCPLQIFLSNRSMPAYHGSQFTFDTMQPTHIRWNTNVSYSSNMTCHRYAIYLKISRVQQNLHIVLYQNPAEEQRCPHDRRRLDFMPSLERHVFLRTTYVFWRYSHESTEPQASMVRKLSAGSEWIARVVMWSDIGDNLITFITGSSQGRPGISHVSNVRITLNKT